MYANESVLCSEYLKGIPVPFLDEKGTKKIFSPETLNRQKNRFFIGRFRHAPGMAEPETLLLLIDTH